MANPAGTAVQTAQQKANGAASSAASKAAAPAKAAASKAANAVSSAKNAASNMASQAKGMMDQANGMLNQMKGMAEIGNKLNLGALAGKMAQVGLATAILQKAMPSSILPKLAGAMGAVQIIKNVATMTKEAKKASKEKSGIGDDDKAAEEKQKAAEEKANKQKEKEEARDKAKEEEEKAKKEAGEADVAELDSKIEQASQNAKSSDNLQKDSLGNLTGIDVPDYNMITPDDDLLVTRAKQEAQMKRLQSMGNVSNAGSTNNSSSNNFGYSGDITKGFNQDSGGYNFNGYSLMQQPKQSMAEKFLGSTEFSTDTSAKASSTFGSSTSSSNIINSASTTSNTNAQTIAKIENRGVSAIQIKNTDAQGNTTTTMSGTTNRNFEKQFKQSLIDNPLPTTFPEDLISRQMSHSNCSRDRAIILLQQAEKLKRRRDAMLNS